MDIKKFNSLIYSVGISIFAIVIFLFLSELVCRFIDPLSRKKISPKNTLLRYPLPEGKKEEGEFRILALGDSYTWGDGIADPSGVWPSILEKRLKATYPEENIRVINMGICGLTTLNELELLVKVGKKLEPDLVIVEYLINDILPSGPSLRRVGTEWLFTRKPVNLISFDTLHAFFSEHSYLYDFINYRYLALQRKIWPAREWAELYQDNYPGWVTFNKALRGIRHWTSQRDIEAIFVIFNSFPKGKWTEETFPNAGIHKKVMMSALRAGLRVLYLLPEYIKWGKNFSYWVVSPANAHPNEKAQTIAAQAIWGYITKNGLIK